MTHRTEEFPKTGTVLYKSSSSPSLKLFQNQLDERQRETNIVPRAKGKNDVD